MLIKNLLFFKQKVFIVLLLLYDLFALTFTDIMRCLAFRIA